MTLTAIDRERIRKMRETLEHPHFLRWNKNVVHQINVSDGTTLGAIERGRKLDLGLRTGQIELTQASFDKTGLQIPLGLGKKYLELATHRSTCEKGPLYRDQRRYGTGKGEQAIVDQIRKLAAEGKSFRDIARTLNADDPNSPREGEWHHTKISRILEQAEQGKKLQPCTCRMFRYDWVPPRKWSICWEILQLTDRTFEAMRKSLDGNFYDITIHDIRLFRRSRFFQPPPARQVEPRPTGPFVNRIILGDCQNVLTQLPGGSVSCVVTSPPYGEQRKQYAGKREVDYPEWTVEWMEALRPALKEDGSIFIIIREHIKNGEISDYVYRTILALRKAGWKQPERMIWYKKDGGMGGAVERPRRNFEDILWFSKSAKPFVNLTACGKRTSRKGMTNKNPHGNFHTDGGVLVDGIARIPDVITLGDVDLVVEAPVGGIDHDVKHPAMFPPELVRTLIRTFAPPGSVILDPFVGSGTTCLVAQALGYDYLGIDKKRAYVALAEERLKTARGPVL